MDQGYLEEKALESEIHLQSWAGFLRLLGAAECWRSVRMC